VVRVVAVERAGRNLVGDGIVFHIQASAIADGFGFVDGAFLAFRYITRPSAQHPPLFPLILSGVSWLGHNSVLAHQRMAAVLSAAAVPLVGLGSREIAGPRAGLAAAGVAAVYPNLWANDAWVMSESLYVTTIALTLWMLARLWKRPTLGRAISVGVAIAIAALTREEAILLLPFAVVPLSLGLGSLRPRQRVALIGAAIAAAAVVTAPWIVRNVVTFKKPVLLAENSDSVIAGANCNQTYYGRAIGSWNFDCTSGRLLEVGDESVHGARLRTRGIRYARAHLGRLPLVVAARVGRAWEVYQPFQGLADVRSDWTRRFAVFSFYALLPIAVLGLLELRRQSIPLSPFLAQAVLVTLTAALGYGLWRLRLSLDVAAITLAGVTLAKWSTRWPRKGRAPTGAMSA
jgi:4-amino-4-deoxy-L-arabinose transferase-like glycosyltransferase